MSSAARRWTRPWPSSRKSARAWPTCCNPAKAAPVAFVLFQTAAPPGTAGWRGVYRETAMSYASNGARFREAVESESPLQVMGAITAYAGLMAKRTGYKALYLSGGGVAANSLGMPDLGISTMEDVLTDARRIVDATGMPLLADIDTGWGGAFNIGRTIRSFERIGVAAVHMEDQVGQKRCGHRPGKEVVPAEEMVDRVKAAVDARNDEAFVIMARTDAAAVEGIDSAIERAVAYVEAGADMIFPEAMRT